MSIAKFTGSGLALVAALCGSPLALADDACYAAKDVEGVFTGKKLLALALAGAEVAPGQPQLTNAQFNGVKRCFAKANQRTPGFQGGMELGLRADASGKVKRVSVLQTEHNDTAYAACVAQLACDWQIANAPSGGESLLSFALGMDEKVERPDFLDGRKVK